MSEAPVIPTPQPAPVEATEDTTGGVLFTDKRVVAISVDGQLRDLFAAVTAGETVAPVLIDSPEGLSILRHSAAHVAAQAVQSINPEARLGIGPPITDGFYYDFDVD